jgi:hypothetical protein
MFSTSFSRITGVLLFCLAAATTASAQYGGGSTGGTGGTGGTGSTGSSGYGSGNGKAIGIGVGAAAGAAVGIALLVHHHHVKANSQQASVVGCTQSAINGLTLKNEKNDVTYTILSSGTALQPGQRVELKGVASEETSGIRAFTVHQLVNNFGACGSATADRAGATNNTLLRAAN